MAALVAVASAGSSAAVSTPRLVSTAISHDCENLSVTSGLTLSQKRRAQALLPNGCPARGCGLPVGSTITIGTVACTALPDGITCNSDSGGFTFQGGVLTRTGTEIPPTAP